jgi:pSer/pThr/pTyr-binding forkhead associated (FHA) protein
VRGGMPVTVIVRSGAEPKGGRSSGAPSPANLSLTLDSPMIVIGRGEGSEVRLPDPSVSHRHATIRQRGSEYILVDEGSTNGTFMGGVKLGALAPRILKHGDMARVGRVWIEMRFDAQIPTAQSALATKELALALVARAMGHDGEPGGPRVAVVDGPDKGKELALDEAGRAYVIGRGKGLDLALDDVDASRRHVEIVRRADLVTVRDLGSKNGAALAGQRIDGQARPWKHDQELQVGGNTFAFRYPALDALADLERAADEKIRADETIPPPEVERSSKAGGASAKTSSRPGPPDPAARAPEGGAPIAEVPRRKDSAPRRKSGWNSTDFLVVLLALSVLALSVLGLYWLLRG